MSLTSVKRRYEEVKESFEKEVGVRHVLSHSPHLSNIFVDDIVSIISEDNTHASVAGNQTII
jgi:hypothetical protein